MLAGLAASAGSAIRWDQLHLSPVALDLGFLQLRWYALSYMAMLLIGWWFVLRLLRKPGAPMTGAQADSLVIWITIGVIAGGRLGWCVFYNPAIWATPLEVLKIWQGGMSFHGGFLGLILALWLFCRRHRLSALRVGDYVGCAAPFGLFLVRLANFTNGELWGRPTGLPWGMIFPGAHDNLPRHPSQLYEAVLEGLLMAVVLWTMFYRTDARYRPGRLMGVGLIIYATARFLLEFVRQPDAGLEHLPWGLTMGQTLSLPLLIAGIYLLATSGRRERAEDREPVTPAGSPIGS
jgi:phosphatidylglycerol:prolipoprotein diacylglycerol transferase